MSTMSSTEINEPAIAALEPRLTQEGQVLITVRGQRHYVVMTVERYHELRELELAQAAREAQEDYRAGRVVDRTIDGHLRTIETR